MVATHLVSSVDWQETKRNPYQKNYFGPNSWVPGGYRFNKNVKLILHLHPNDLLLQFYTFILILFRW